MSSPPPPPAPKKKKDKSDVKGFGYRYICTKYSCSCYMKNECADSNAACRVRLATELNAARHQITASSRLPSSFRPSDAEWRATRYQPCRRTRLRRRTPPCASPSPRAARSSSTACCGHPARRTSRSPCAPWAAASRKWPAHVRLGHSHATKTAVMHHYGVCNN